MCVCVCVCVVSNVVGLPSLGAILVRMTWLQALDTTQVRAPEFAPECVLFVQMNILSEFAPEFCPEFSPECVLFVRMNNLPGTF